MRVGVSSAGFASPHRIPACPIIPITSTTPHMPGQSQAASLLISPAGSRPVPCPAAGVWLPVGAGWVRALFLRSRRRPLDLKLGVGRARVSCGSSAGSPRCMRARRMLAAAATAVRPLILPPHFGHSRTSTKNIRLSSKAQAQDLLLHQQPPGGQRTVDHPESGPCWTPVEAGARRRTGFGRVLQPQWRASRRRSRMSVLSQPWQPGVELPATR